MCISCGNSKVHKPNEARLVIRPTLNISHLINKKLPTVADFFNIIE